MIAPLLGLGMKAQEIKSPRQRQIRRFVPGSDERHEIIANVDSIHRFCQFPDRSRSSGARGDRRRCWEFVSPQRSTIPRTCPVFAGIGRQNHKAAQKAIKVANHKMLQMKCPT
jgi:hypothetical protein